MKKILIFGLLIIAALIAVLVKKNEPVVIQPPDDNYQASLETTTTTTTITTPVIVTPPPAASPSLEIIPKSQVNQGGTLRIVLKNADGTNSNLIFQNKTYSFFNYGGDWNALIPIAYDAPTGSAELAFGSSTEKIIIEPGNFKIVTLTLPQLVTSPQLAAQYQTERKKIVGAYNTSALNVYFSKSFGLPLDEINVTNDFGVTYFDPSNGSKTFHNGVDLKAAVGTPVKAINDGVVKIADNYILEGNFVMIDHGHDVFSDYLHLSKIMVTGGKKIMKGQIIGLAGDSGEAVGPHLHFIIKINNVPVDPLAFINLWQ